MSLLRLLARVVSVRVAADPVVSAPTWPPAQSVCSAFVPGRQPPAPAPSPSALGRSVRPALVRAFRPEAPALARCLPVRVVSVRVAADLGVSGQPVSSLSVALPLASLRRPSPRPVSLPREERSRQVRPVRRARQRNLLPVPGESVRVAALAGLVRPAWPPPASRRPACPPPASLPRARQSRLPRS